MSWVWPTPITSPFISAVSLTVQAVDLGAVGRSQVDQRVALADPADLCVRARHVGVVHHDGAARRAADGRHLAGQLRRLAVPCERGRRSAGASGSGTGSGVGIGGVHHRLRPPAAAEDHRWRRRTSGAAAGSGSGGTGSGGGAATPAAAAPSAGVAALDRDPEQAHRRVRLGFQRHLGRVVRL